MGGAHKLEIALALALRVCELPRKLVMGGLRHSLGFRLLQCARLTRTVGFRLLQGARFVTIAASHKLVMGGLPHSHGFCLLQDARAVRWG